MIDSGYGKIKSPLYYSIYTLSSLGLNLPLKLSFRWQFEILIQCPQASTCFHIICVATRIFNMRRGKKETMPLPDAWCRMSELESRSLDVGWHLQASVFVSVYFPKVIRPLSSRLIKPDFHVSFSAPTDEAPPFLWKPYICSLRGESLYYYYSNSKLINPNLP